MLIKKHIRQLKFLKHLDPGGELEGWTWFPVVTWEASLGRIRPWGTGTAPHGFCYFLGFL